MSQSLLADGSQTSLTTLNTLLKPIEGNLIQVAPKCLLSGLSALLQMLCSELYTSDKSQSHLNFEHAFYEVLIGLTACEVLDKVNAM